MAAVNLTGDYSKVWNHAYDVTWSSTGEDWYAAQDAVWEQWYDIRTSSGTTATRYYPMNTTGTITTAQIHQANYRWSRTVQAPVWQQWERMYIRERETEEQAATRLLRDQERRDRIQREREEASRRRLAEAERLEGAHQRGLALLEMLMTPEERLHWEQRQELMVRGSDGGMFVIEQRGVHGNVREIDEHGCILGRICVAPEMYDREERLALPLSDGWVGQYLAIKHQEQHFRESGNWSGRRECQHPGVPILRAA